MDTERDTEGDTERDTERAQLRIERPERAEDLSEADHGLPHRGAGDHSSRDGRARSRAPVSPDPDPNRTSGTDIEVSFVGSPPTGRIARASGVSEVEVDGATVRCRVTGSVQPFLEALCGHEVIALQSAPMERPMSSSRAAGEM